MTDKHRVVWVVEVSIDGGEWKPYHGANDYARSASTREYARTLATIIVPGSKARTRVVKYTPA